MKKEHSINTGGGPSSEEGEENNTDGQKETDDGPLADGKGSESPSVRGEEKSEHRDATWEDRATSINADTARRPHALG